MSCVSEMASHMSTAFGKVSYSINWLQATLQGWLDRAVVQLAPGLGGVQGQHLC